MEDRQTITLDQTTMSQKHNISNFTRYDFKVYSKSNITKYIRRAKFKMTYNREKTILILEQLCFEVSVAEIINKFDTFVRHNIGNINLTENTLEFIINDDEE